MFPLVASSLAGSILPGLVSDLVSTVTSAVGGGARAPAAQPDPADTVTVTVTASRSHAPDSQRGCRRAALPFTSGAGWADAAPTARPSKASPPKTSSKATGANDPLAFLHDSKLSVEEKLMRLLAQMSSKWEKEMNDKLEEIGGGKASSRSGNASGSSGTSASSGSSGTSASSGSSGTSASSGASGTSGGSGASKGGLLDGILGGVKQFFPAVGFGLDLLKNPMVKGIAEKIGGPVMAAAASAMGCPALAPILLKYGPQIVDFAAGAAEKLDASSKGGATGASSSGSASSSAGGARSSGSSGGTGGAKGGEMSDSDRQLKLMEIQRLQEKQKEMFQLVSNTLKAGHDLRMSIVGNLR